MLEEILERCIPLINSFPTCARDKEEREWGRGMGGPMRGEEAQKRLKESSEQEKEGGGEAKRTSSTSPFFLVEWSWF